MPNEVSARLDREMALATFVQHHEEMAEKSGEDTYYFRDASQSLALVVDHYLATVEANCRFSEATRALGNSAIQGALIQCNLVCCECGEHRVHRNAHTGDWACFGCYAGGLVEP